MNRIFPIYNISSGDIYEIVSSYELVILYVYAESAGFIVTNWIGNTDGMVVKIGYLMFAIDGWNKKLYRNTFWGGWSGWIEIK